MKRINLIPDELIIRPGVQVKKEILTRNVLFLPIIVMILYLVFADAIPQFVEIRNLQSEVKTVKETFASARKKIESFTANQNYLYDQIDEWKQKLQLLREEKDSFDKELKGRVEWSSVLMELSRLIPREMWLDKAFLDKGILTIEGSAFSNIEVSKFLKNLKVSPVFSDAEFRFAERQEMEEKKKNIVKFQIVGKIY